jgi:hypothetical protein
MRLLTTILVFAAAGCVGNVGDQSGDDTTTDNRTAKQIFKADVHPSMGKCSGGTCHDIGATSGAVSKFYNTDSEMTYTAAVAAPTLVSDFSSLAPILQKVQAGHKGVSYMPDEVTKITNWLAKETAERANTGSGSGSGSNPPVFDSKAALATWSGCMSLENFNAANMTLAWSTLGADNLQKCINCHIGGISGFYINNQAQPYFDTISTTTAYLLKYFTVDTTQKKVVVNQASFKSATMISGHPTFNPTTNAGMTALVKFYDLTAARQAANQCDQPRLKD